MHATNKTETLERLANERFQLVQELRQSVEQQLQFIQQQQMSRLLQHLTAKQKVVNRFAEVQQMLLTLVNDPTGETIWPNAQQQAECRQVVQAAEDVLRQVVELEQACEEALQAEREQLATQIDRTVSRQRAVTAYRASATPETSQLDLSSD